MIIPKEDILRQIYLIMIKREQNHILYCQKYKITIHLI